MGEEGQQKCLESQYGPSYRSTEINTSNALQCTYFCTPASISRTDRLSEALLEGAQSRRTFLLSARSSCKVGVGVQGGESESVTSQTRRRFLVSQPEVSGGECILTW